jgi:microcystin-dependent protein
MELISESKGWIGPISFDTFVPELNDDANIQDALKMFFFGSISSGTTYNNINSIYHHLISLKSLAEFASGSLSTHVSSDTDTHGIGAGAFVVGTTTSQTLSNKTLSSPVINSPSFNTGGLVPVGSIVQYAGSSIPIGWLSCNGSAVGRNTYSQLFSAIGIAYGSGDGSTTFNLPNLSGRVPVGLNLGSVEFSTLGQSGGNLTHGHTISGSITEAASHTHTVAASSSSTGTSSVGLAHSHNVGTNGSNTNAGGGHSHSGTTGSSNGGISYKEGSTNRVVTLTQNHNHGFNTNSVGDHSHGVNGQSGGTDSRLGNHSHNVTIDTTGNTNSSGAHTHLNSFSIPESSIVQPYTVLNYIIKF